MSDATDYLTQARELRRLDFVQAFDFPFLIGTTPRLEPMGPQKTGIVELLDEATLDGAPPPTLRMASDAPPLVAAVRKSQSPFPGMITVGRTSNNDIVLRDVTISKFHAFFRITAEGIELADAGSRNGTWVGRQKLAGKGAAVAAPLGSLVRFGALAFHLVDAGQCWDLLNKPQVSR